MTVAVLAGLSLLGRGPKVSTRTAADGDDFARYHERVFGVVRVVDGDTLDINAPDGAKDRTRIRLWGVDTPEVKGSPRGAMHWGAEASTFAKETLVGATVGIELLRRRTRDRYGRLLAYVYLPSGKMFNELLVEQGHAYADVRFGHPYRSHFSDLEISARASERGLWRDVTLEEMPEWRQRREPADQD